MTAAQLDAAYSHLCHTMTRVGEAQASIFLARLALLALSQCDDAEAAKQLIDDAALETTALDDNLCK